MARRRWLWVLGGAALVVLGLVVAAKLALRAGLATGTVEAKLQQIVGGRVEVGGLDVGLGSSTLRDVRFFEEPKAGAPAPAEPWVRAKEVEADATLTSLIAGHTPRVL